MVGISVRNHWMWAARPAGRPAGAGGLGRTRRAEPLLEPHERILRRRPSADGTVALGTDRALVVRAGDGAWTRFGWADIAEAAWSADEAAMLVTLWPVGDNPARRITVSTEQGFAALAAERVAASQVLRRRVQLTGTKAATVVATRTPGRDGVTWRVFLDQGREDDPAVARAAARALADLRALAGC